MLGGHVTIKNLKIKLLAVGMQLYSLPWEFTLVMVITLNTLQCIQFYFLSPLDKSAFSRVLLTTRYVTVWMRATTTLPIRSLGSPVT